MAIGMSHPAIGPGPISFTNITTGKFFLIPLSALEFDANGELKFDNSQLYVDDFEKQLKPFLKRLQDAGVIAMGPEPATKPALKATAVTPGGTGVDIKMTFANSTPNETSPASSTADVTVEETDAYTRLALTELVETIGNEAFGGARPGLVFVSGAAPTEMPKAGDYPLKIAASGGSATADVTKDGGGNAFTLQARSADAGDALFFSAKVSDVDATAKTFTLTVSWYKSVKNAAVSALADAFAFVVKIEKPLDGDYRAPATGTFTLAGGFDAVSIAPVKAAAIIPAAS